jgi:hypothetical protein
VVRSGTYAADFLYTSNRGGTISVDVNGEDVTGPLQINTTAERREWRHTATSAKEY